MPPPVSHKDPCLLPPDLSPFCASAYSSDAQNACWGNIPKPLRITTALLAAQIKKIYLRYIYCFFLQAALHRARPGIISTIPLSLNFQKTLFIEFSDFMPVSFLPSRFVISEWLSKYFTTISSGEASRSCLIYTVTDISFCTISGVLRRNFVIASNAVLSPSPTSLLGAFGNLLIRRTSLGLRAACVSRIFSVVT